MMPDAQYRDLLTSAAGVRDDLIATLSSRELDLVGNIVQVYRTSMQEQDPAAFQIWARKPGKPDGGPAFPSKFAGTPYEGMSQRKWFAGCALQGMMAHDASGLAAAISTGDGQLAIDNTARLTYALADAMIAEGSRKR